MLEELNQKGEKTMLTLHVSVFQPWSWVIPNYIPSLLSDTFKIFKVSVYKLVS